MVAFLMYRGTLDYNTFYCWLALQVLPAIRGTGPRVLMGDRHRAHFGNDIETLLASEGHLMRHRAVHSPDTAWVEWCFEHAQKFCRINEDIIRAEPDRFAECFAAGRQGWSLSPRSTLSLTLRQLIITYPIGRTGRTSEQVLRSAAPVRSFLSRIINEREREREMRVIMVIIMMVVAMMR
jgi:hypothetical protein